MPTPQESKENMIGCAKCEREKQKVCNHDYSFYDHYHCWDQVNNEDSDIEKQDTPACGQPLEKHTQCCLCSLPYEKKEKTVNFVRAGETVACGHCDERFIEGLKELIKRIPDFKCDCKCHKSLPTGKEEDCACHEPDGSSGIVHHKKSCHLEGYEKCEICFPKRKESWLEQWRKESACWDIASSVRPLIEEFMSKLRQEAYNKGLADEGVKCYDHCQQAKEEGAQEERQFVLNILDGIDEADRQMGNKGGGTKAIRFALKSRIITNNKKDHDN